MRFHQIWRHLNGLQYHQLYENIWLTDGNHISENDPAGHDTCILCQEELSSSNQVTVGEKGHASLIQASSQRDDGLASQLLCKVPPFGIHITCRKDYTRVSSIETYKRKRAQSACDNTEGNAGPSRLRSSVLSFDIKYDCFYCTNNAQNNSKLPKGRQNKSSDVATIEYLCNVLERCDELNDAWSNDVKLRIQNVGDLVAAEAKYHRTCGQLFALGRQLGSDDCQGQTGRPMNSQKALAFEQLCRHIDTSDECQYSFTELCELYQGYLGDEDEYSSPHLNRKLKDHYGNDVTITVSLGKPSIYSFRDTEHNTLRAKWEANRQVPSDNISIVEMAASIIRNDIRTMPFDCSEYPRMDDFSDCANSTVPETLHCLLHGIIKSNTDKCKCERRCAAIAHSIMSACRPRSFVSPILLAVAVYIHRKYASRELIDILNTLGFSDDYKEVQRLNTAFLAKGDPDYNLQNFTQFVFDNADFNVSTLTGHDTFHANGGIAVVTPPGDTDPCVLKRNTQLHGTEDIGQFSNVPLRTYKKPLNPALKTVIIGPLEQSVEEPLNIKSAKSIDNLWLANFVLGVSLTPCPSWSGFMQISVSGLYEKSKIEILPFINQDPSNPNTIYSALYFAQQLTERHGLGISPVTFDQPLYIKAVEIVMSSPDLPNIFVRLGGFHLLMSYMGSLGFIMAGSGLESMWETVYAPNSIQHMLTGHAYSRALRAHILSSAAISSVLLETPGCLTGVNIDRLQNIKEELLDSDGPSPNLSREECLQQFTEIMDGLMMSNAAESRTGKLWISYLNSVHLLRLFIFAERTGDWKLHLFCISQIIPLFHAAGHFAYAKSARLYLCSKWHVSKKQCPSHRMRNLLRKDTSP